MTVNQEVKDSMNYRAFTKGGLTQIHSVNCPDIEKIKKQGWNSTAQSVGLKSLVKHIYSDFISSGEMSYEEAEKESNIKPCAQSRYERIQKELRETRKWA